MSWNGIGLGSLLRDLQGAGLRVGVDETLRLQEVLADPSILDPRQLRWIVAAVIVKSRADQDVFDRHFDRWWTRSQARLDEVIGTHGQAGGPASDTSPKFQSDLTVGALAGKTSTFDKNERRLRNVLLMVVVLLVLLAGGITWMLRPQISSSEVKNTPHHTVTPTDQAPGNQLDPTTSVEPTDPPGDIGELSEESGDPPLEHLPESRESSEEVSLSWESFQQTVFLLMLGCGLWWLRIRKWRMWVRPPSTERLPLECPGPQQMRLHVPDQGTSLLDLDQEDDIVWSFGRRYVSDTKSGQLDLDATVRATAAANGLTQLHFTFLEQQQRIWLWVDRSARNPLVRQLAEEVSRALSRAGLQAEMAFYMSGLPWTLTSLTNRRFSPTEIDARRGQNLVLILTDGQLLNRLYYQGGQRSRIENLLRSLSHWPRLAFVDFSGEQYLRDVVEGHQIPCFEAHQVAALLSEGAQPDPDQEGRSGWALPVPTKTWAAVCALAPDPVDTRAALAIRSRLNLEAPVWDLHVLNRLAAGSSRGPMIWPVGTRANLLHWLCGLDEVWREGKVNPNSLLSRAIREWEQLYKESGEQAAAQQPDWEDTLAGRRCRLARALLRLWIDPDFAVVDIYLLHQNGLKEVVESELRLLRPAESEGSLDAVVLPWRFSERKWSVQAKLMAMRFAGEEKLVNKSRGHLSTAVWLFVFCWLSLVLASGITAIWERPVRPPLVTFEDVEISEVSTPTSPKLSGGLPVKILWDNSGSMYPGYSPPGTLGRQSRREIGVRQYHEYNEIKEWLEDFVNQQSILGADSIEFSFFASRDSSVPGTIVKTHDETPLEGFDAGKALDFKVRPGRYTYLASNLARCVQDFEGLVWLITDNIVEESVGTPDQGIRDFFQMILDEDFYRSVHFFKLPFSDDQAGVRGGLAIYAIRTSLRAPDTILLQEFDRKLQGVFLKSARKSGVPLFPGKFHLKLKDLAVDPFDLQSLVFDVSIEQKDKILFTESQVVRLRYTGRLQSLLTQHRIVGGSYFIHSVGSFRPSIMFPLSAKGEDFGLPPVQDIKPRSGRQQLPRIDPRGSVTLVNELMVTEPISLKTKGWRAWWISAWSGLSTTYRGNVVVEVSDLEIEPVEDIVGEFFGVDMALEVFGDPRRVSLPESIMLSSEAEFSLQSSFTRALFLAILGIVVAMPLFFIIFYLKRIKGQYRVED